MSETVSLSLRVSAEKARLIDELSAATDRPKSWILEQALDAYLATNAWQVARIRRGLADVDAGRTADHEKVGRWLGAWGTGAEGKPPKARAK